MKLYILALFALSAGLFGLADSQTTSTKNYVEGEYLVKLKPQAFEMLSTESLESFNGFEVKSFVSNASKIIVINSHKDFESVKEELSANPNVEYVERNSIFRISGFHDLSVPNDTNFGDLWGMQNTGQTDASGQVGVAGIDIDAVRAWDITTGSRDIVVAVIDTGVDYTLSDLQNNIWTNEAEANGTPGVDDDGNGFVDDIHGYDFANNDADPMDDHGHGSHCSGTIGGEGNNGSAVAGVNWEVKIMALKFLSASGSGTLEGAVKAIDYATQMGARLSSNSWGCASETCNDRALNESIQRASDAGILFVAAAGNNNANNDSSPNYPSNFNTPNMLAVAAIDNRGNKAVFSSYGKTKVHIAAPGVKILSTTPDGLQAWSGTSMATPHVAGAAALILSQEPELSMTELKERILHSAKKLSSLSNYVSTGGMLNVYHALMNTVPVAEEN